MPATPACPSSPRHAGRCAARRGETATPPTPPRRGEAEQDPLPAGEPEAGNSDSWTDRSLSGTKKPARRSAAGQVGRLTGLRRPGRPLVAPSPATTGGVAGHLDQPARSAPAPSAGRRPRPAPSRSSPSRGPGLAGSASSGSGPRRPRRHAADGQLDPDACGTAAALVAAAEATPVHRRGSAKRRSATGHQARS